MPILFRKIILLFVVSIISVYSYSQVQQPSNLPNTNSPNSWMTYRGILDSLKMFVVHDTTFSAKYRTLISAPDGNFYYSLGNGTKWNKLVDTAGLHNGIVALQLTKVNLLDSNIVYVTPFYLSTHASKFDSTSLSNRINNKLNVYDTLNNVATKTDLGKYFYDATQGIDSSSFSIKSAIDSIKIQFVAGGSSAGGGSSLNGLGFVRQNGLVTSYDNSNYLTNFSEVDPSVSAWAKTPVKPSYSYSELTGTALGDNLGNHIATMDLDMNGSKIINLKTTNYTISGSDSVLMLYRGSVQGVLASKLIPAFPNLADYARKSIITSQTFNGAIVFTKDISIGVSNGYNMTVGNGSGGQSTNIAIGYQALQNNYALNTFDGRYNTAIGYQALLNNDKNMTEYVAVNNTAIGYLAGTNITDGRGTTIVGSQSGTGINTGDYNTILGYKIGTDIITGSNNTIIGANADILGDVSNNIVIMDGSGSIGLRVNALHVPIFPGIITTAPTSATATGTTGEIRVVSGFIYVCIATNTWQRSTLAAW